MSPALSIFASSWSHLGSTLDLSENELSGTIPSELGSLTNLEVLKLSKNQLSGTIPPELGNLTNLAVLDLFENRLSGTIPPELGNLINLMWIPFETTNFRSDFEIGAKESLLHS